jgi:hypothetical protein
MTDFSLPSDNLTVAQCESPSLEIHQAGVPEGPGCLGG